MPFGIPVLVSVLLHVLVVYFVRVYAPAPIQVVESPPWLTPYVTGEQVVEFDLTLEMPTSVAVLEPAPEAPVQAPRPVRPAPQPGPAADGPRITIPGGGSGAVTEPVTGGGGGGAGAGAGDPNPLDRLRYQNSAREVWRPSAIPLKSPDEVVRERVAAQLDAYNDSIAAEEGARERALDWTAKGADGKRWGVSPGAIHLGDVTIPLPFSFAASPEKREEVAGRVATWGAIQQQATHVEGREIIKDRVKAMEQRKAAERAARQGTTTSGGGGGS